jgi:hypothetical protein
MDALIENALIACHGRFIEARFQLECVFATIVIQLYALIQTTFLSEHKPIISVIEI